MDEVGRLFNDNQLIVAEVLQSAEAMKAAVSHLEPHMEKAESATRGVIVLATVKGDVHDIGKNLVEIIFGNNGYRVINLGIKVPPEDLIAAYHTHKPDAFGLSGLLVKSAQQMVVTAQDLKAAGIARPRAARAPQAAAGADLPLPEPPDALRQAPRPSRPRLSAARGRRSEGARAPRRPGGAEGGGGARAPPARRRRLPLVPRPRRGRDPPAPGAGRRAGRALHLPAPARGRAALPGRLRARRRRRLGRAVRR